MLHAFFLDNSFPAMHSRETPLNDDNSQITSSPTIDYQEPPRNQICEEPHPKSVATNTDTSYQNNKLVDELLAPFAPFDAEGELSRPFEEELARDTAFIEEQAVELLGIMLETWAWNISRIRHTTGTEGTRLSEKLRTTIEAEKEIGTSDFLAVSDSTGRSVATHGFSFADLLDVMRQRLQEFVVRVRSAIDALRGF